MERRSENTAERSSGNTAGRISGRRSESSSRGIIGSITGKINIINLT